jgi:hypothetical protein
LWIVLVVFALTVILAFEIALLPTPSVALVYISPFTEKVVAGLVVPIPTFPVVGLSSIFVLLCPFWVKVRAPVELNTLP